ncbi:astacin-like metalloprotease toxin 3 [Lepeophtheirus salmonis]|uniref:astacin-like metalloprotease toxin 3 n=1 Tax=Lepeophtheirus salmonis TaxID=72036 RepID=UPI001AEA7746|nr:zinc metalloproteinase nas-14-like [Lepeophtheirus salmonis]
MGKLFIAIVLFQILLTIYLSGGNVSDEGSCKVLLGAYDRAAMYSRNFIGGRSNRWPNGIVPYIISSNFTSSQRQTIMDAIKHISDRTCVNFVERTNQTNYVDIFTGESGCYANLGYNSRRSISKLHLQSNGCVILGIITHELLHILGFSHEQTRPDRDQYVKINWENIDTAAYPNFWRALGENEPATIRYCGSVGIDQYDNCIAGFRAATFGLDYDYGSVMHYGLRFFSRNNKDTISLKKSTTAQIPNRSGMSSLDIQKTKLAYDCQNDATDSNTTPAPTTTTPARTTTTPAPTTTSPAPTSPSPVPTTPAPSTSKPCVDTFRYCKYYKNYCGRHSYINRYCKKTCFNCVCENDLGDVVCSRLSGYCRYYFIKRFCQKTCRKC